MGVVDRVHRCPSNKRPPAFPSVPPGFADGNVLAVEVSDLPDSCPTIEMNSSDL
jgi:hypothetical protein